MTSRIIGIDRNTFYGLSAILLWSTTVALARSIGEQIGPLTAGASVYLAAGSVFVLHAVLDKHFTRRLKNLPPLYLFGCGALFLIYTIALFIGLGLAANRHQAIEVGLVNYLWPALTILLSLFILSKRARFGLIPGTVLAVYGVFVVLTQGSSVSWKSFSTNFASNPMAYGLGLVAAVSWALYSNLARRWAETDGDGAVPLFLLVTGLALLLMRLLHPEQGVYSVRVAAEIVFMGMATALAYVLWDIAMRKGDVVFVAACSYLTPFFSTVVSCIYLKVVPSQSLLFGCLLIIIGSIMSWRSVDDKEPAESTRQPVPE